MTNPESWRGLAIENVGTIGEMIKVAAESPTTAGDMTVIAVTTEVAKLQALLAVDARLAEQVEQQKLANVIAAFNLKLDDCSVLDYFEGSASERYIRDRIGEIVNPGSETE